MRPTETMTELPKGEQLPDGRTVYTTRGAAQWAAHEYDKKLAGFSLRDKAMAMVASVNAGRGLAAALMTEEADRLVVYLRGEPVEQAIDRKAKAAFEAMVARYPEEIPGRTWNNEESSEYMRESWRSAIRAAMEA